MFGIKLWFTSPHGCTRCGRKGVLVASPGWGAAIQGVAWCARCLRETGRTR